MAKLLEGRLIAERIKNEVAGMVKSLGAKPVLVSVQVGENPAAASYIRSQQKTAEAVGIEYRLQQLAGDAPEAELLECVQGMNADVSVDAMIIQMPLPGHVNCHRVIRAISPAKDAEGIHPENVCRVFSGDAGILPCTAAAVMAFLKETGVDLAGKEAVVVGHGEVVGKPIAMLLLNKLATVTVCHIGTSRAGKLAEHVRNAEILVAAAGKAGLIKGEWVKEGAVVIDVGINRLGDKIAGDVEFETARQRASYITPVPGGVGPLTAAMLMRNLLEAVRCKKEGGGGKIF